MQDSKLYGLLREPSNQSVYDSVASLAGATHISIQQSRPSVSGSLYSQEASAPASQNPSSASALLQQVKGPQDQEQLEPLIASPFLPEANGGREDLRQQREPSIASPFLQEANGDKGGLQQQREPSIVIPFLLVDTASQSSLQHKPPMALKIVQDSLSASSSSASPLKVS
jgi:hypothetical protein